MARKQLNFWGFSPALDLHKEITKIFDYLGKENLALTDDEEKFLVLGSADGRHMLKTIASMDKHSTKFTKVYFVEDSYLNICRQLLFLYLLCEERSGRSLLGTTEAFLEIFGNVLVRYSTHDLIRELAGVLRVDDTWKTVLSFVSTDGLKHKELNKIRQIYSSWYEPPIFDIKKYWEERLRRDLGRRYDCRRNLFDWDFHTTLKEWDIIGLQKYIEWRESGVAFKCRESRYAFPNLTLAHYENSYRQQGYFGDVCSSPYLAYGIETEEKSLLQKVNGVYEKTSEDISVHNVVNLLKNIEMLQPIQDRVKIYPLVGDSSWAIGKKTENNMDDYFDCIYISHDCDYDMRSISNLLKENGILLVETLKYAVVQKKEWKKEYCLRVQSNAAEAKLTQLKCYDFQKHPHIAFMKLEDQHDFDSIKTATADNELVN